MRAVKVDLSRCQGHGRCYSLAPVMMQPLEGDDRSGFVGTPFAPGGQADKTARMLVDGCPERALSMTDDCGEAGQESRQAAVSRHPGGSPPRTVTAGLLSWDSGPRLRCPCGELLAGRDDDALVREANNHLATAHPEMANSYTREQILLMAF